MSSPTTMIHFEVYDLRKCSGCTAASTSIMAQSNLDAAVEMAFTDGKGFLDMCSPANAQFMVIVPGGSATFYRKA